MLKINCDSVAAAKTGEIVTRPQFDSIVEPAVGYENHVLGRQYDDMLRRLKARQEENEAYAEAAELLQEQVEVYGYDLDDEEEE